MLRRPRHSESVISIDLDISTNTAGAIEALDLEESSAPSERSFVEITRICIKREKLTAGEEKVVVESRMGDRQGNTAWKDLEGQRRGRNA